jgi:PAS domain-containing protein
VLLIKRGVALFFFLLFTLAILAVGLYAYLALDGVDPAQSPRLKTTAESILFVSITGAAGIVIAFFSVVWRTVSLYRELDKIIELNKQGEFSPELSMKKLGGIGERITLLYFTLNSLNERKTLKISALSGLAEYFADRVDVSLFVTDVQGYVRYVSASFLERAGKQKSDFINVSVEQLFPDVLFQDAVVELDRSNSTVELTEAKDPITLVGVRNRRNELDYVVWHFDGSPHFDEGVMPVEKTKSANRRSRGTFWRHKR